MGRRKKINLPLGLFSTEVESLTHDGKGVAHVNGKVVFIEGALPAERVIFRYTNIKKSYDEGEVTEVLEPSPDRVRPECEHFTVCGGCSLQHLSSEAQLKNKHITLIDNLQRIGKVKIGEILTPMASYPWGYRRRARLGVKYVAKKGKVLVGFREKKSPFLADIASCKVLDQRVGARITELCELIASMELYTRIPQIEVAMGDHDVALVFRHLDELPDSDLAKLAAFGEAYNFQIYGQIKGPATIKRLWAPSEDSLNYHLSTTSNRNDVVLLFRPSDFTQVNSAINQKMVNLVLELLQLREGDRVLDLFCGLGNFTIPIAKQASYVVGIEGSVDMVRQASLNAQLNKVENVEFHAVDLTQSLEGMAWATAGYDKVLIDPPRSGALEVLGVIAGRQAQRIVYVSCNPATLARDAYELVNVHGYELKKAGVMDMFPHTAHVESIAVFEKN